MSVDLTLCPDRHDGRSLNGWWLAYERISLDGDGRLWDAIKELPPHPLPPLTRFTWYSDGGLEDATTDKYGEPLTYATAGELGAIVLPEDVSPRNAAVFAYLRALPAGTPVVLWWH